MVVYNRDIPATPNNPSNDQPLMKTNTNANDDIWAVDHVGFNSLVSGKHQQVTFISENSAAAPTDPVSVLYTGAGTASSIADLYFRNQNGRFRPNALRAFGVLTTVITNGAVVPNMSWNVDSVVSSSNGQVYTINLTANAVNGTTVVVFLNLSNDGTKTWTFAANQLTVTINAGSTGSQKLSFQIIQV